MRQYSQLFFKYALLLSGVALATTSFTSGSQQEAPSLDGNRTEEIRRLPSKEVAVDFTGVAKKAIPAVVSIQVQSKKTPQSLRGDDQSEDPFNYFGGNDFWQFFGFPKHSRSQIFVGQASGVIIDPKGYILTNSHVVHGMDKIVVLLNDSREFPAKVVGDDPNSDLAVIKIEAQELPYLTLGNSDQIEVGQWVAAIGNPLGLQGTLTVGVISAKSRDNLDISHYEDFIQTDAAINRGNSGGPLVTLNGEVVGINTAIATNAESGYLGIGFSIPSNTARHVLDEILSDGKVLHGFLGVTLQSIDYNLAKSFGLKKVEGALVTSVVKNSAAEKAGLQPEDIILRYDDRPVETAATLRNAVYMMKPGTKITLTILRQDQHIQIPAIVENYSDHTSTPAISQSQKNQLGIEVGNLTPEIAQKLGDTETRGVVIMRVDPSSVAALAGLKKGALILAVNRQKVSTVEEFNRALAQAPKDRPILLQIKQGDLHLFVSLQQQTE